MADDPSVAKSEAAVVLQETLTLQTKVLGAEHPNTLLTKTNLAVSRHQSEGAGAGAGASEGSADEGAPGAGSDPAGMLRESLEAQRRVLGYSHEVSLRTAMNLANVLRPVDGGREALGAYAYQQAATHSIQQQGGAATRRLALLQA